MKSLANADSSQNEADCVAAAQAFGRGLHSKQDESAHRLWPQGVAGRGIIPHPGWWDTFHDYELPNNYCADWWWHRYVHREPDYDTWLDTPDQRFSQARARYKVGDDTYQATGSFSTEVRKHCFCKRFMLSAP